MNACSLSREKEVRLNWQTLIVFLSFSISAELGRGSKVEYQQVRFCPFNSVLSKD